MIARGKGNGKPDLQMAKCRLKDLRKENIRECEFIGNNRNRGQERRRWENFKISL